MHAAQVGLQQSAAFARPTAPKCTVAASASQATGRGLVSTLCRTQADLRLSLRREKTSQLKLAS